LPRGPRRAGLGPARRGAGFPPLCTSPAHVVVDYVDEICDHVGSITEAVGAEAVAQRGKVAREQDHDEIAEVRVVLGAPRRSAVDARARHLFPPRRASMTSRCLRQ
jgi:hypothetical protein